MDAWAAWPCLANFPIQFQGILNVDESQIHRVDLVPFSLQPIHSRIGNAQLFTRRYETADAIASVKASVMYTARRVSLRRARRRVGLGATLVRKVIWASWCERGPARRAG